MVVVVVVAVVVGVVVAVVVLVVPVEVLEEGDVEVGVVAAAGEVEGIEVVDVVIVVIFIVAGVAGVDVEVVVVVVALVTSEGFWAINSLRSLAKGFKSTLSFSNTVTNLFNAFSLVMSNISLSYQSDKIRRISRSSLCAPLSRRRLSVLPQTVSWSSAAMSVIF